LGAGLAYGILAAGREAREPRAFSATLASAAEVEPEAAEVFEPLSEPLLAEPSLSESLVWAEPEPLPAADEPQGPLAPRSVDWLAERPLAVGVLAKGAEPPLGPADEAQTTPLPALTRAPAPVVLEPVALRAPAPTYPRLARRAGEEGSVLLRLHLDPTGAIVRVEIVESSGFERLDEAAREALAGWSFEPRREDGQAVATSLLHRVTFRLSEG
jgi:protein TonB